MVPLSRNHFLTPVIVLFSFFCVVITIQNGVFNNKGELRENKKEVVITPQNGVFNNVEYKGQVIRGVVITHQNGVFNN